ncbi:hypothetical protein PVL29_015238 [Vitis rotundifolia]|uniref:Uncharacterized protein n=1 Tax=Vitis rotundifolia TaxID=103349 RepID=A0AA38ZC84_VITRO|nr:hypothetical protein PVL29_015238 [Vitis rotundifolia]
MIGHPSNEDLRSTVRAWYPELEPPAGKPIETFERILVEAVDIFVAFSVSAENRLTLMQELVKMRAPSDSVAEAFYPPNKPNLAMRIDQKLTALNLSQQSDVADLLGRKYHAVSLWPLPEPRAAIHLHPNLHQITSADPTCRLNQFMV